MNPVDLLVWAGVICLVVVMVAIAVVVVIASIRAISSPSKSRVKKVMSSDE